MMVEITASDGHTLGCWMQPAEGQASGGLVILQEIFGVTEQLKGLAERYAALGYEVAIPALFDRQQKAAVIAYADAPAGRELMSSLEPADTLRDIEAAVKTLADRGLKVAVMGFCWGGGLAIRSAQKLDIDCAIAFYGTRLPQYLDSPLQAPLQAHFGKLDDHVPPEMLAQAKEYLPDMEVFEYDAGHAFANDAREEAYVAAAAEIAHGRSQEFLAKYLA